MEISTKILIIHFVATIFMVGLIWVIQVVHYPLFGKVGTDQYVEYQQQHEKLITLVVAMPMLVEAATALLLARFVPAGVSTWLVITGIVLVLIVWLSTAFLQVPCHAKLASGFDAQVHQRLVNTNWIRTVAWTLRGVLVTWMLYQSMVATNPGT